MVRRFGSSDLLHRGALVAIFFLSGAAGLVYEVVWSRQLSLTFGVTTYAVATVLATFMGGLALGSWLLGRAADRWANPLLAYALLEAGIGVYALLVPYLFAAQRASYVVLRQLDLPYAVFSLGRGLLAGLVLLVPTTLMGGTFPILTRFWVRSRDQVAGGAGLLYFVNTAGAIAGCMAAGFWLIERLGIAGTNRLAASANLAIAAGAVALAWRRWRAASAARAAPTEDVGGEAPASAALALVCIGLSGFTALAYEVLWTRALLRFLYNSTYAFTTMLATFLAGIALGSAFYAAVLRRVRRPLLVFAALQALVGAGFAASTVVFPRVVPATTLVLGLEHIESFGDAVLAMFLRAALVLLPPTFFLGATLPLAADVSARSVGTLGRSVGRVYAINTLGAILGSLAAAFVLIPGLGMQRTITVLVGLNFAAAAALAVAAMRTTGSRLIAAGVVAAAAAVVTLAVPADVFMRTFYNPRNNKLIFYREGATDTVGVVENPYGQRVIVYEDQRGTAGTATYGFNFFLGHLPMLLHPGEPRTVLHICFGVGNSLSAVAAHDTVERVDNVELSPHVVEAAHYFWTNDDVLANPKVRTIIDDGRNFLLTTRESYDVVLLEPPETFTAGVMNLYTREFYEEALARLAPDGLMMQWIPTGSAPLEQEAMLFRTFWEVFPHVTAWWQLDGGCMLLVGSRQPLRIDYRRLRERMSRPRIRRDLDLIGVIDADHLLSFFRFDEAAFAEFVRGVAPVTDDRTVLDFSMPRYLGSGFGLGTFNPLVRRDGESPLTITTERTQYYASLGRSVVPYLTDLGDETREAVAARIAARATTPVKHGWISEAKWRRL
jgi:spermidine synthase